MNIIFHLKRWLIRRSLNKRRLSSPFVVDPAENYSLSSDADKNQSNSYYFSCHDMKGNSLLLRYAKRGGNQTEVWFAYKDADGNAYVNDKQHYTGECATAGVNCKKPGEIWSFFYDGELRNINTQKICTANFNGTFTAEGEIFEFGHHLDSDIMAKAIAKEKWSKAFFKSINENNQIHYEQQGSVSGTLCIDGKSTDYVLPAMRDHSYGKRDWNYMNKYFWLMALFEDGSSFNANMVSYPAVKSIQTGYFVLGNDTVCVQDARILEDVKSNTVPDKFTFEAVAGGRKVSITCKKETEFVFAFNDGEYIIYEGIGTFELDGKKARGVLEFGYNGDASRLV